MFNGFNASGTFLKTDFQNNFTFEIKKLQMANFRALALNENLFFIGVFKFSIPYNPVHILTFKQAKQTDTSKILEKI